MLLNNRELRANFSRAAQRSMQRFAWDLVGQQMATLYEQVMAGHHTRAGSRNEGIGEGTLLSASLR